MDRVTAPGGPSCCLSSRQVPSRRQRTARADGGPPRAGIRHRRFRPLAPRQRPGQGRRRRPAVLGADPWRPPADVVAL